jgi:hypothetical protein
VVNHCVGNVGNLGARRPRLFHHRAEHLRGGDDGLRRFEALPDDGLLVDRDRSGIGFERQVTARDHHRVRRRDDVVKVIERFSPFNFHNDVRGEDSGRQPAANQPPELENIRRFSDKGKCDKIYPLL